MRKLAAFIIGGVLGGVFATPELYGSTIISDLSAATLGGPDGSSAVDFSSPAEVGTQFTMGATGFNTVSFILGIVAIGNRSLGPVDVTVSIYGGDTSAPSGSPLLTIAPSGNFNGQFNSYTYNAPAGFTLDANTTYWIVASSVQNQEGWIDFSNLLAGFQPAGSFATAPAGYNRSSSGLPTSIFTAISTVAYEVDGTAVGSVSAPEPSTFALTSITATVIGCCMFARRRRFAQGSR